MLPYDPSTACADNGSPKRHGYGEAERRWRQGKLQRKRMRRARDDGRIKAEQKAAERPNNRASPEVGVQSRMPFPRQSVLIASFPVLLNEPARFESHKGWLARSLRCPLH